MTTIAKLNALCQKYTTKYSPVYMSGNTLCACDFSFNLRPLIKELDEMGVKWNEVQGYFAKDHMSGKIGPCRVELVCWN